MAERIELPENSPARELFDSLDYRRRRDAALHYPEPRLTERQMQIVALLHEELEYKEIAFALGLTEGSIKTITMREILRTLRHHHSEIRGKVGIAIWWERLRGKEKGYVIRVA